MDDNKQLIDVCPAYNDDFSEEDFKQRFAAVKGATLGDLKKAINLVSSYCSLADCAACAIHEYCDENIWDTLLPAYWPLIPNDNTTTNESGSIE